MDGRCDETVDGRDELIQCIEDAGRIGVRVSDSDIERCLRVQVWLRGHLVRHHSLNERVILGLGGFRDGSRDRVRVTLRGLKYVSGTGIISAALMVGIPRI